MSHSLSPSLIPKSFTPVGQTLRLGGDHILNFHTSLNISLNESVYHIDNQIIYRTSSGSRVLIEYTMKSNKPTIQAMYLIVTADGSYPLYLALPNRYTRLLYKNPNTHNN